MYPTSVLRQIQRIRDMMAEDYTIEEIQKQFLFVRGDIEDLERTIGKVFEALKEAAQGNRSETAGRAISNDLATAEGLANELLAKLEIIEQRLITQAALQHRAAVGA
ncbi:Hypothetical protein A7982_02826 [Minicystis rosea]|nr:Hypothetical protein A7982_02826 [Minicystis rosea]